MPVEIEIKLLVSPADAERFARSALVREAPRRGRRRTMLESTYYDTADRRLHAAGIALRVRRDGRHWIQTVKSAPVAGGALQRREESETVLAVAEPDIASIAERALRQRVRRRVSGRPLGPLLATRFERRIWILERSGSVVEIALDQGTIIAGDRTQPLCEIELELRSGSVSVLFDLAREVLDTVDARIGSKSKFERGLVLAGLRPDDDQASPPPPVDGAAPAIRTLASLVRHTATRIATEFDALRVGYDVECVHAIRVELRRLASLFHLFRGEVPAPAFGDEARALRRAFGAARNLDVLHAGLMPEVVDACGEDEGMRSFVALAAAERGEARAGALAMARSGRAQRFLIDVDAWCAEVEADVSISGGLATARFAQGAIRRLQRRLDRALTAIDDASLHATRIRVKRLRYSLEALGATLARKHVRWPVRRLRALQGALGRWSDLATALDLVTGLAAKIPADEEATQRAAAWLRGWIAHALAQALAQVRAQVAEAIAWPAD